MPKLLESHTVDEQSISLADNLLNGICLSGKKKLGTNLQKLLLGFSGLLVDLEQIINLVSDEYDIAKTTIFIDQWEKFVAIPDDCFDGKGTLEERRRDVLVKLGSSIQTEQDYMDLALLYGETITIESGSVSGAFPMVFPIVFYPSGDAARHTMIITFDSPASSRFTLVFPFIFGSKNISILECLFKKLKPANVDIKYRYT